MTVKFNAQCIIQQSSEHLKMEISGCKNGDIDDGIISAIRNFKYSFNDQCTIKATCSNDHSGHYSCGSLLGIVTESPVHIDGLHC